MSLRRSSFSLEFNATYVSMITSSSSSCPNGQPSAYTRTLPYPCTCVQDKASVLRLAPLYLPRKVTRLVSYYAFFKGLLLLSQPPSCQSNLTTFTTERRFRDLSCCSGLFPSRRWTLSPTVCLPGNISTAFGVYLGLVIR